ncbi:hypothetical protein ACHAWU_008679 [Discostella pseudostelligera]|uniref:Secreted protein n=1 Tax=Discostella pseudostelligera TaxID=259834 RepID=A0ABD3M4W5_9STRA
MAVFAVSFLFVSFTSSRLLYLPDTGSSSGAARGGWDSANLPPSFFAVPTGGRRWVGLLEEVSKWEELGSPTGKPCKFSSTIQSCLVPEGFSEPAHHHRAIPFWTRPQHPLDSSRIAGSSSSSSSSSKATHSPPFNQWVGLLEEVSKWEELGSPTGKPCKFSSTIQSCLVPEGFSVCVL